MGDLTVGDLGGFRDNLHEMEHRFAVGSDRQLAFLELCARSGSSSAFDTEAFVERQLLQLQTWSQAIATRSSPTGSWPTRLGR